MTPETLQNQEADIIWTATAERILKPIQEMVKNAELTGRDTTYLQSLITRTQELFAEYEKNGKSINEVYDDLEHRQLVANAEDGDKNEGDICRDIAKLLDVREIAQQ